MSIQKRGEKFEEGNIFQTPGFNVEVYNIYKEMTLKQKYLHENGPFPFNFQEERVVVFDKIISVLKNSHPNQWASYGINAITLIESYKQIYGFTTEQYTNVINMMISYIVEDNRLAGQTSTHILKLLNHINQLQIAKKNLVIMPNTVMLKRLEELSKNGIPYPLKWCDQWIEEFVIFLFNYSRHGQDCTSEIIRLAINYRDSRFMVLFIRSVKEQKNALLVIKNLFVESSMWDRDGCWFFILSELMRKFPQLDYTPYYPTLLQEIIKMVTTLIDPYTDDDVKKLMSSDPLIPIPSLFKSAANILNFLLFTSNPQPIWSALSRIFSIISASMDHVNQQPYLGDFFVFMKQFSKNFLTKYREESQKYLKVNEDFVEEFSGEAKPFDPQHLVMFDGLWDSILPKLLYFEDSEMRNSKLLSDLAIYNPQKYMEPILNYILDFLEKDLTLVSLQTSKMTIIFLQQHILSENIESSYLSLLLKCCNSFLLAMEKLGVSENLDLLELVTRIFIYLPESMLENYQVQSLIGDVIDIILHNLDPISINLQGQETEQADLYIDLKNIFFPFILRLNPEQLKQLSDKFLFKIKSAVPTHRQAYELITTAICYVDKQFTKKIIDFVYKGLVTNTQTNGKAKHSTFDEVFPHYLDKVIHTHNEENISWLSGILQAGVQYNPEVLVQNWQKIETVVVVMMREWENAVIFDKALDLFFNYVLCFNRLHLPPEEFRKQSNRNYETMNVQWNHTSESSLKLLTLIRDRYFQAPKAFLKKRYQSALSKHPKVARLRSDKSLIAKPETLKPIITVPEKYSELLDNLITPSIPTAEDLEEKKLIYKIIAIQYTLYSAFQQRGPFTPLSQPIKELESMYLDYGNLRKDTCQYIQWLIELLSVYNCLWDPVTLKNLHFFWREAHDELFLSASTPYTNQKLVAFFYPQNYKKKQLYHSAFLILNQTYLIWAMRIELLQQLEPTAYLNNSKFFDKMIPFSFCVALESSLKSRIPKQVNIHEDHLLPLLNLCRLKLSPSHPNGYVFKYLNTNVKEEKEKYLGGIRLVVNNIRKYQNLLGNSCCVRDENSWYGILEVLQVYPYLEKKADKVLFLEVIYMLLIFYFDTKGILFFNPVSEMMNEAEQAENTKILNNMKTFIKNAMLIVEEKQAKKMGKNKYTIILMILLFSEFLSLEDELLDDFLRMVLKLLFVQLVQLNNILRVCLFRLLNRVVRKNTITTKIPNTPVKRPFEEFLIYRHLGGTMENGKSFPLQKLNTGKLENYFYPLETIKSLQYITLSQENRIQKTLLDFFQNGEMVRKLIKGFLQDTSLKINENSVDVSYIMDEQSKRINSNGHKLVNYVLDADPEQLEIFSNFVDNFSSYPVCFYQKFFRKILQISPQKTIQIMVEVSLELMESSQAEQLKMFMFLGSQLLSFTGMDYLNKYIKFLTTCSNQNYDYALTCLIVFFNINFQKAQQIYSIMVERLREEKGPTRLRHLSLFNSYVLCQGRFGRKEAIEGLTYLLKGVDEGSSEVSDLVVSMLISCFIISINLEIWNDWVEEPLEEIEKAGKIYKLTQEAGYQIDQSLRIFLKQIITKTEQETDLESKNLQIYSKIAYQILSSITVYRFNDTFYNLLKDIIVYVVKKPTDESAADGQILNQLKDSEYPNHIYQDLIETLRNMEGSSTNVIKKRIRLIEGITINKCFCLDKISLPDILPPNQKAITMDHIVALSNIARLYKPEQLRKQVERILEETSSKRIYIMMVYLLAAGTREQEWREPILKEILKAKKLKIVKEFVSAWWKGRSPETEEQQRLYMLVRNVQNPYSYFA